MDDLLSALLGAARAAGAIPQYHESFAGKLAAMQSEAMRRRYALSSLDAHMLSEMHEIVEEHKKAATIFPRNGTLVVADDNFQLRTLSVEKLKTYLERSKSLYTKLYDALTRNPELFA